MFNAVQSANKDKGKWSHLPYFLMFKSEAAQLHQREKLKYKYLKSATAYFGLSILVTSAVTISVFGTYIVRKCVPHIVDKILGQTDRMREEDKELWIIANRMKNTKFSVKSTLERGFEAYIHRPIIESQLVQSLDRNYATIVIGEKGCGKSIVVDHVLERRPMVLRVDTYTGKNLPSTIGDTIGI
jgi:hypothetical protein